MFDWETERKEQIKRVKNICYYKPSLLKKRGKKGRRTNRKNLMDNGYVSASNEPNKQLFDLYQSQLRQSQMQQYTDGEPEEALESNINPMSQATGRTRD